MRRDVPVVVFPASPLWHGRNVLKGVPGLVQVGECLSQV